MPYTPVTPDARMVYICSPYAANTLRTIEQNLEQVRKYCKFALSQNCAPLATHLAVCGFLDDNDPEQRTAGISIDEIFMKACDELWIFGDLISNGMSHEIATFEKTGKPIRRFTENCEPYAP